MVKTAFISKHIVLTTGTQTKYRYPIYGIILVEDEFIVDVVPLDSSIPPESFIQKYSEWNPIDYSDFYISPGIIDFSVRSEWESDDSLTRSAIAGGVTLVVKEVGFSHENTNTSEMYCDVGSIVAIRSLLTLISNKNAFCYKLYLTPPDHSFDEFISFEEVFKTVEASGRTLLIDPNFLDRRLQVLASPLRFVGDDNISMNSVKIFAGALPDKVYESGDESEDESPEHTIARRSLGTPTPHASDSPTIRANSEVFKFKGSFEIVQSQLVSILEEEPPRKPLVRKKTFTIFDDLNKRIKRTHASIHDLSLAELSLYKAAGTTQFRKRSLSAYDLPENAQEYPLIPAPNSALLARRSPIKLPMSISTAGASTLEGSSYIAFLANRPESGELKGLERIFPLIPNSLRVHITGVSSASALNFIRKAQQKLELLSSEISASSLYFSSEDIPSGATIFKSAPPIRNKRNCELLWDLLKLKGINCICSQHAGIPTRYKEIQSGDFNQALNGINCLGQSLQSVWSKLFTSEASKEQLEHYLLRLAKWFSLFPAEILGVAGSRGSIDQGKYADLVIWSPYTGTTMHSHSMFSSANPFQGHSVYGEIHTVYLRGTKAFAYGEFYRNGKYII